MKRRSLRELTVTLACASPEEQVRIINAMTPIDLLHYDAEFEAWAHDSQLPPPAEGWRVWLMQAGRGFGKTRAGAEWIHKLAMGKPGARIALAGATLHEARSVMVEGVSGLLTVGRRDGKRLRFEPSNNLLRWPNGSQAELFSGDNADGLRGPEHDFAWADELAKWGEADAAWMNLQMGLRRGPRPRVLVTTTPRSLRLLDTIEKDSWTATTRGRTSDNLSLDRRFIEVMTATYGGTRIGRQELDGERITDVEGSLWPRELIERSRTAMPEAFDRVVVGVDPPGGATKTSDACGIVVAGRSGGRLFVLADESCQGLSPDGWARRVETAVVRWNADIVIAEANNGGAMVGEVLRHVGVRVKLAHAHRGKSARAEPIAFLFENGSAAFAGSFA
jgi:phage terminase large subunit-like protein